MAATITQALPETSFTKNLPNIIISEVEATAYLSVSISGKAIVTRIALTPDTNKRITIYTRQLVQHIEVLAGPWEVSTFLPKLNIKIEIGNQTLFQPCKLIPGGIAGDVPDISNFLARNFLTWQPQIIETTSEQPQFIAFIKSDRYTKIEIHSTLVTTDGNTFTKMIDSIASSLIYAQIDVSFPKLWRELCETHKLTPVSYDVFGRSYLSANPDPEMRPLTQRYLVRADRYNDTCFGFANTLGGFDTLMMQGKMILKPDGEGETFLNDGKETELTNGFTSYWEGSTGGIDTNGMAAQYQDFLKSTSRWIYRAGTWQKIIVDEYKVEHTPLELNAYTFKFHMAEKDEYRYFNREDLPAPTLPTKFFNRK